MHNFIYSESTIKHIQQKNSILLVFFPLVALGSVPPVADEDISPALPPKMSDFEGKLINSYILLRMYPLLPGTVKISTFYISYANILHNLHNLYTFGLFSQTSSFLSGDTAQEKINK